MHAHNESADSLPTARGSAPQKRGQEMEHEDQKMEGEARTIKSCLELAYPSLTAMLFQVGEACAFGRFGGSVAGHGPGPSFTATLFEAGEACVLELC